MQGSGSEAPMRDVIIQRKEDVAQTGGTIKNGWGQRSKKRIC